MEPTKIGALDNFLSFNIPPLPRASWKGRVYVDEPWVLKLSRANEILLIHDLTRSEVYLERGFLKSEISDFF